MFRRKTERVPLALVERLLELEAQRFDKMVGLLNEVEHMKAGLADVPMQSEPLYMSEEEEDKQWAREAGIAPEDVVRAHELFKAAEFQ